LDVKAFSTIKVLLSCTVCLLVCAGDSGAQQSPPSAPVSSALRQQLLATVPTPLPAGVVLQGTPVFYSSANLYEYMDGGADIYQLYDVQAVLHEEFRKGEVDLTADIFDMGTAENAFGMYASERSPKYDFVAIGAEGYQNEGIVNFFQDRFYVKLAAFGDGAGRVLDEFARGASKRIGRGSTFPALIGRLPVAGRQAHSEKFIRKDPLGHSFLSPAYQASYQQGRSESILMVSVAADSEDARMRMKSLAEHFRSAGHIVPAPEFGEGAVQVSNSYEGTIVARVAGRYLVLLVNPAAGAEAFFKDAAGKLE
jgi:hypothetical protein